MSDEEETIIQYPSGKVGAVTKVKNEITKYIEDNPDAEPEELEKLKDKLNKKIENFNAACDEENRKDAPEEDLEEFNKWRKQHVLGNKTYVNKLERIILQKSDGYETSSSEDKTGPENISKNLLQCFKKMQISANLPQHEPQIFDGTDVTQYQSFQLTFQQAIEKKCDNYDDKYYYLLKYTGGDANILVRSCHNSDSKKGYDTAMALLQDKYGNEYTIAHEYLKQLQEWSPIKAEDGPGLSKFASFLTAIENLMNEMSSLNQLNSPRDIRDIIMKLPYNMRVQFRNKSADLMDKNKEVTFSVLVQFVNQQAKQVNVPLFGDISDKKISRGKDEKDYNKNSHAIKSKTFYTNENKVNKFCPCCKKNNHFLNDCYFFARKTYAEKEEFIKVRKLCFGCLKNSNHSSKDCINKLICRICERQHPSCLHRSNNTNSEHKTVKNKELDKKNQDKEENLDGARNVNFVVKGTKKIACPAIPVYLKSKISNKIVKTYAALDNQSSSSYMDHELLKDLQVHGKKQALEVTTIDDNKIKINTNVIEDLEIISMDKSTRVPLSRLYAKKNWPFCSDDSPTYEDVKNIPAFENIPFYFIDTKIGILIGMNQPDIIKPLQIVEPKEYGMYASRHKIGWCINGPVHGSSITNQCFRVKTQEIKELENKFEKVFNTDYEENVKKEDSKNCFSPEEQRWLSYVTNNCTKSKDSNKYEIKLPLKSEIDMPNNYLQVYSRLQGTRKKLMADEELKDEYSNFMQMMLDRGYMEMVPEEEINPTHGHRWYLTHHGVRHKRKGKLRIVFDCSLQYKGLSLNDMLWKGPDLTNSLVGVLMRFRENNVAVSGDIEKMFYNVQVPKEDRTYLRFLWYNNSDFNTEPTQYWLTVHLFGATSSPAIANFALKKCVEEEDPVVRETVNNAFYVDDLLASFENDEEAIINIMKVSSSLQDSSFNLTSFASNSRDVLLQISPENETNKELIVNFPDNDDAATIRALGMKWNTSEDVIGFDVKIPELPCTRRGVLSTIFSIYDPLFLATPALIKAKRIFQITCAEKLDWDEPLPPDLYNAWMQWKDDVSNLSNFKIPRCYKNLMNKTEMITNVQLHIFSDGSEVAYGAVAYLRLEDSANNVSTSIIMSKSRLTPLDRKSLKTVPRIELNAAKLGVTLYEKINEELKDMKIHETFFWTDSKSTLQYIFNETKTLQRFVANRVAYIRSNTDTKSWKFVPGDINPADQLSRGVTQIGKFITDKTWTNGPLFLNQSQNNWPSNEIAEELSSIDNEVKKKRFILTTKSDEINSMDVLIHSTDDIHKLSCRIVAFLRLKEYLKTKVMKTGRITVEEIKESKKVLWKYAQKTCFSTAIQLLKNNKTIPKKDPLKKLTPFIDNEGLLRVGGRLTNANMPYSAKYPIILHASFQPVQMLIKQVHLESGHLGRETILTEIKKEFHIIKANKTAREIIEKCTICRRVQAKPANQLMSDLPDDRIVGDAPPFTNTGTDIFGPFYVSRGRGKVQEKRYGVIFSCLVSRATHIELTSGLDTDSYINALRRFIARRGKPSLIRSDNGTNLTSAEKELKNSINEWNQHQIYDFCLQNQIQWKFQPPQSSHFGGAFERQIRTIRKIFNSLLCEINNQTKLTDDILNTLFAEVENIMNNIPLTVVTSDVHDNIPLTPNSLLRMQTTFDLPPCCGSEKGNYYTRTWKRIQHMADMFWTRFKKEYLPLLNYRQKWREKRPSLNVGDVVIISDLSLPRNNWCLGRVISVNKGSDGLVRSAEVITNRNNKGKQKISRPIHKLILIQRASDQ